MKKYYFIFILLSFALSKSIFAKDYPTYILFKKFSIQCHALDSINGEITKSQYPQTLIEYRDFESWAATKGDDQLQSLIKLYRLNITLSKEKTADDLEKNILALIKDADEKKQVYVKAEALELIADYYWETKEFASGLENYIYAYESYNQFSIDDFPHKAEFLHQLGGRYYYFRDFETAKKYFLEVWNHIPYEKMGGGISKLNTLALCYSNLEEYDSSIYYFNKALDFATKDSIEIWIGIISGNLGSVKIKQNKYDEAIPLMEKNIAISRKNHVMEDLAVSVSEYGALLLLKNDFKKDLDLQMEALDIIKTKKFYNRFLTLSRIYPNLAKAYAANGNMALAYAYSDSSYKAKINLEKERSIVFVSGVQHKIDIEKHKAELQQKEAELKNQKLFRNSLLCGLLVVLFFTGVFFRQRNKISKEKKISETERERSDNLLLNILPAEVAEELKATGSAKAKQFDNVSVLFTDFVGFTLISEKLSPQQLVEEIHHCFTEFDKIIERNGLEKIKTIGDAYLAVCGMPIEMEDHAKRTVKAAIEIMEFTNKREIEGGHFKIRIGINSGPVVAGIVGVKKFAYDIWGDTVNTAARMEQNSRDGQINISGSTYVLVKNDFKFIHRGKIEAKNKGEVDMYFVESEG